MDQHRDLLPRYQQIRKAGLELNNKLVRSLSKEEIETAARAIGFLRKKIVLGTEDEISVLMDYCLHDSRCGEQTPVERYLAQSPPP